MAHAIALANLGNSFIPPQLPGCTLWLRADLAFSPAQWNDNSGQGNNVSQATPSQQFTFHANGGPNGLSYVSMSGAANQFMTGVGAPASTTNFTMFSVAMVTSTATTQGLGGFQGSGAGISHVVLNTAQRAVFCVNVAGDVDQTSAATTNWELWMSTGTAAPLQTLAVNGTAHTLSPNNTAPGAAAPGIIIGAFTSASAPATGGIREWIVYNRVLAANEIALVNSYVRAQTLLW